MIPPLIFWISVVLIAHSYIFYPLILQLFTRKKKLENDFFLPDDELPTISVVMSVHNEEKVIFEKIRSLYYTLYPIKNLEILVGSDASTDGTNRICKVYEKNYEHFRFFPFTSRQGKPDVINKLVEMAKGEIIVLTDAKVFFTIDTLFELVKYFKDERIEIVGGNILNEKTRKDGISVQEKAFMNRELIIKYNEGLLWGQTIGVYGAIYAIRKSSYNPVPAGYSVDDFFITMKVLKNKGKVIMNPEAVSREDVPNLITTEFRRKVRISTGNFQNLKHFSSCLWPPCNSLAFAFLSHKVLRWLGPFFILSLFISNVFLINTNLFYKISFFLQGGLLILPLIDYVLKKIKVDIALFRYVSHFFAMNAALFTGFVKFLSGKQVNIWQPTRR